MEDPANPDPTKPWSIHLPNGTFLYPRRYRWINAIRTGRPPSLEVVLECLLGEPGGAYGKETERIHFGTYEEADAFGTEFVLAMAQYFPEVTLGFIDRTD